MSYCICTQNNKQVFGTVVGEFNDFFFLILICALMLCISYVSVELHALAKECVNKFMIEGEQSEFVPLEIE